jgi:uncharacterized protein YciI
MAYWILFYDVVDDYLERRPQFREEHLGLANGALERGELLMAGAFANPPDGAALLFKAGDGSVAEEFARNDPYVKNGLVKDWRVREWTVVISTLLAERSDR